MCPIFADGLHPLSGLLLPLPDGLSAAAISGVRGALVKGKGAITPVETTSGGFGQGQFAAPRRDYEEKRFGPAIPETSIALRKDVAEAIHEAYGLHGAIFSGDGNSHELAVRSMFLSIIEPLSALITWELSAKLGGTISLSFQRSQYRHWQRLSRAFKSFVEAGVSFASAANLLGLDLDQVPEDETRATPPDKPEAGYCRVNGEDLSREEAAKKYPHLFPETKGGLPQKRL